jgi:aminocarboxymuconate-semialdehyde decarboxylase
VSRVTVIDVHAHVAPDWLQAPGDPRAAALGLDLRSAVKSLRHQQTVGERLADMDRLGVDVQVLSTQGQLYCSDQDAQAVLALHRLCNEYVCGMVARHADRFEGLAIIPMQDVDLAIGELTRAHTQLGLRGVMVGDHVNGALWDERRFEPFWAAAESLGALVLVHQAPPTLVASRTQRYHLANTVGNLVERTVTFATLVLGGVMDRHPDLQVCLAHGGGYACFAAGRMDWGYQWREEARQHAAAPPSAYLGRFFYDSITHSEAALRFLVDAVGADRVLFGTDYPGFAAGPAGAGYDPVAWLRGLALLTDAEKKQILSVNALSLLRR